MNASLARRLEHHFKVVAAAGTLAAAATTQASVVYSGVVNLVVPRTTAGLYLNFVTGVSGTAAGTPGWDINPYFVTNLRFYWTAPQYGAVINGTRIAVVPPGTMIDGTNALTTTLYEGLDFPTVPPAGIYGVRFQDEGSGNAVRYGWARILNSTSSTFTIVDYAYENSGAGIVAGNTGGVTCYANCDSSTSVPFLNVQDFTCFLQKFSNQDSYANCDASTTAPALNVQDFTCFLQKFSAGCSAP